jgi:hypothetical protein
MVLTHIFIFIHCIFQNLLVRTLCTGNHYQGRCFSFASLLSPRGMKEFEGVGPYILLYIPERSFIIQCPRFLISFVMGEQGGYVT